MYCNKAFCWILINISDNSSGAFNQVSFFCYFGIFFNLTGSVVVAVYRTLVKPIYRNAALKISVGNIALDSFIRVVHCCNRGAPLWFVGGVKMVPRVIWLIVFIETVQRNKNRRIGNLRRYCKVNRVARCFSRIVNGIITIVAHRALIT